MVHIVLEMHPDGPAAALSEGGLTPAHALHTLESGIVALLLRPAMSVQYGFEGRGVACLRAANSVRVWCTMGNRRRIGVPYGSHAPAPLQKRRIHANRSRMK